MIKKPGNMEAKISQFFDSVSHFFNPGKNLPCTNRDIIHGCEKRVAEISESGSDEQKRDSLLQLSWALVHSSQAEDVQRGKDMLEASLASVAGPSKTKEKLYLLAVGCYKSGEYLRSLKLVEQCLEIHPDWNQALGLKRMITEHIQKDGVIGIGITATTVGLIASGIIAAFIRK